MNRLYLIHTNDILAQLREGREAKKASVLCYDAMRMLSSLQGILNREKPTVYLLTEPHDRFWLEYMSEEGKLLCGYERVDVSSFDEILEIFKEDFCRLGLVLWDPALGATANVASTLAGVEDLIPIRASEDEDSICQRVIRATGSCVNRNLCGMFTGRGMIPDINRKSSGSAKCDAYLWAMEKYMDKTHKTIMFYTLDGMSWDPNEPFYPDLGNAFVYNQDYAVYQRAFVFDLSCWGDETPWDDPDQPMGTDLCTMKEILQRKYDQSAGKEMITVCGFNPWHVKYTRHMGRGKHEEVESEWEFTEVVSAYNCIKDADAAAYCSIANASVYTQYPLKETYKNRRPKKAEVFDQKKTYVLFYVGDYDASAWTARFIPRWYRDENLGKLPLMWCFNPNLSDRIPQAFDFIYERYTENDYFATGDSGAGYNNPRLCYEDRVHSSNPSCIDVWNQHNEKYFKKFDLDIIGFVIDGNVLTGEREMQDMATYAKTGVGYLSLGKAHETKVIGGSVFMPVTTDVAAHDTSAEEAADRMIAAIRSENSDKRFYLFRTILSSPTKLLQTMEIAKSKAPDLNLELLDPYNFFTMAKDCKEKGLTY